MRSYPTSLIHPAFNWPAVVAAIMVLVCACGHVSTQAADSSEEGALASACEKAKQDFREITDADVAASLDTLRKAARRLNRRLKSDTANGPAWRKFLKCELLQAQLDSKQTPDLKVLNQIYGRYASGNTGLQFSCFADVRKAIRSYVTIARAKADPKTKAGYENLVNTLAEQLKEHCEKPTPETATSISLAVRWLEDVGQAEKLRTAIREEFGGNNLMVGVSSKMVTQAISKPVDEVAPVTDCILGTTIRGTGHTVGNTTAELVEDGQRASIDIVFSAVNKSDTVGYNGPVIIHSKGTTNLSARKRIMIDEAGISSLPACSSATTNSVITSICDKKNREFVERIAKKRAKKQKCKAEAIAAQHAEQRINSRIDAEAAESISKAHENFVNKFRRPLTERDLFPQYLGFSSKPSILNISALQADSTQLAAPSAAPAIAEGADVVLQVHDSMINNFTTSALSGMTVDKEDFESAIIDMLGKLPEKLKEDDQEPWSISFTRGMPISVQFADEEISMTIRGRKFRKGEDNHPGMNISVKYKIEETDTGFKLMRQGEPEIFPPGFVPGGGKSMGVRFQVIRTILERRFGRIFIEEIVPKGIDLEGNLEPLGRLVPIQFNSRDGWLTIAWKAEKSK